MSEPIERTDAALRQIENHARAARADLAALRRSPPAPAIDVEAVVNERDELRQRCDDLALIADTWASSDEDGNPWGLRIADHKLILVDDAGDIVLDRDERTGLPILNDAARSALRLRAALGGKEQR